MVKVLAILIAGVLFWAITYKPEYDPEQLRENIQVIFEEARGREQERRRAYVDEHPELPERTRNLILSGGIHYGMTDEQVIASLGEPSRRNISTGDSYREQWVYGRGTYLYFRRSPQGQLLLDSWQVFGS